MSNSVKYYAQERFRFGVTANCTCNRPRQLRQHKGNGISLKSAPVGIRSSNLLIRSQMKHRWKKLPDLMAYWRLSENVDLLWLLFPLLKSQPISWWVFKAPV